MPPHDIVRMERTGFARGQRALGRAFHDYPLMVYANPAESARRQGVPTVYGAILWDALVYGEVYADRDGAGACAWLPPGVPVPGLWRQSRAGMLALPWQFGLVGFRRLLIYDALAQRLHKQYASGPHWYLAAIGVEPAGQGRGLGTALMRPVLGRADLERMPCYLDTHKESNVRLYEHNGFRVAWQGTAPGHPVPIWAMVREPR